MARLFRIFGFFIALVVGLIVIGVIFAISWINPENIKNQLSQIIYKKTGRQIVFRSDIHWSVYPWLGFEVSQVRLNNYPSFGSDPFAEIGEAKIRVQIRPLLHREIRIQEIRLSGLKLNLIKNAKGVGNWETNNQTTAANNNSLNQQSVNVQNSAPNTKKSSTVAAMPMLIAIANFNVTDGKITLRDEQKNQSYEINQLKIRTQGLQINQPFKTNMSFELTANQPNLHANVNIKEKILLSNDASVKAEGKVDITDLQAKQFRIAALTANTLWENKTLTINSLKGDLYQGHLDASAVLSFVKNVPQIVLNSQLNQVDLESLLKDVGSQASISASGRASINLHLTTSGSTSDEMVRNLNGTGSYTMAQGILKGIDIAYWLNVGKNLVHKMSLAPTVTDAKQTDLGNLTGSLTITGGVIQNNDLLMQGKQFKVTGKGTIDLMNQGLNYNLSAQSVRADNGQPDGVLIPLQITGTFSQVKVRPVVDELIKKEAVRQILQNSDQIKEKVTDVLHKNLGKDVGNILKKQLDNIHF